MDAPSPTSLSEPQSAQDAPRRATGASSPHTPSTEAATGRTARPWTAGGDPQKVAVLIGGLFVLAVWGADRLARVRFRAVRRPTPRQRDAIAEPLARIACRHLPLTLVDQDLVDAAVAAAAAHDYLDAGPLITRAGDPRPNLEGLPQPTDNQEL